VPQPMRNHLLYCFSLLAIINCQAMPAFADAKLEGTYPAQWRLVWNHNPATQATLCWSTAQPGKQHRVLLRAAGGEGETLIEAQRNGRYSAQSPALYYHHAELSELQPATQYHVVIESDGKRSPPLFFVTAPTKDVPVSLLFGADSRSGHNARRQMNAMLAKMMAESQVADRVPILALAHGGDYVYDGRNLEHWVRWLSDHELTTGPSGRLLPIIPARGNHDRGKLFNEIFAFPPQDHNYYSVNLSPQVRLLTLNTETSLAGNQRSWLQKELAAERPQRRWLLVQYHRPAFPAVKQPCLNQEHWVPLFEQYNVDLVCEGDGHSIKRTLPIRDFKLDPTGVVYVGEGGLGVGQRIPKTHRWYLNSPSTKVGRGHHVQLLTFGPQQLTFQVVLLGGEVFDEHFLAVREPPVSKE